MPVQETFFSQQRSTLNVEVIKTYDERFAAESFRQMDDAALKYLWNALTPEAIYDPDGLPSLGDPSGEAEAFLWDELREQAREDGHERSFFIVSAKDGSTTKAVYVSPDWPSAEDFAQQIIGTSV